MIILGVVSIVFTAGMTYLARQNVRSDIKDALAQADPSTTSSSDTRSLLLGEWEDEQGWMRLSRSGRYEEQSEIIESLSVKESGWTFDVQYRLNYAINGKWELSGENLTVSELRATEYKMDVLSVDSDAPKSVIDNVERSVSNVDVASFQEGIEGKSVVNSIVSLSRNSLSLREDETGETSVYKRKR